MEGINVFSSTANSATMNINSKIKARQTKYYNEVKSTTGSTPLTFPLEEFIMITSTSASVSITLPLINSQTQLGMTFRFNKAGANRII